MSALKSWITKHPVIAFFALTYSVSWPLFVVVFFLFPQNMAVQGILGSIATFMPAVSGMIISAVTDAGPGQGQGLKRVATFVIVWFMAGLVLAFFIRSVRGAPLQGGVVFFSGLLALLPAYVVSGAFSRKAGVRRYLVTLVRPRGHFVLYALVLLTFPVVQLTGYFITRSLGQDAGELLRGGFENQTYLAMGITLLYGFFFAGGINEECGWRGFAALRLQRSLSPLSASVIVWFFWALWHLFYDIASDSSLSSILLNRLGLNLLWSILFVWALNRAKGSILAPAIFHPAMNTFGEYLPRTDASTGLFVLVTIVVILADRMWQRQPVANMIRDEIDNGGGLSHA